MGHRPLNPDGESSRTARFRFSSGGRRIPCFFILAISVVRFIPNRAAAPYGPPTSHPVASSAPKIRMRSDSFSGVLGGNAATDGERVGRRRFGSNPSCDSISRCEIGYASPFVLSPGESPPPAARRRDGYGHFRDAQIPVPAERVAAWAATQVVCRRLHREKGFLYRPIRNGRFSALWLRCRRHVHAQRAHFRA